jgi:phosphatidylglycerophosphate synthase
MSPDAVTTASAMFSAIAITLLIVAEASVTVGIVVAVLLAVGYLLDSADGQVARLSGRSSAAGEWLDHVVDSIRGPAIHLALLVGLERQDDAPRWVLGIALAFALVAVGVFMSQVLGEQLTVRAGESPADASAGPWRSVLLIPVDSGTLCWLFVFWGWRPIFCGLYSLLFFMNVVYALASVRRKFRRLKDIDEARVTRQVECGAETA